MDVEHTTETVEKVEHKRLERLTRICNELSDRLLFARSLAAYALEMNRLDIYLKRLDEYSMVERQLVVYRYLIGCEWRRVMGVQTRPLPAVIDVSSWV